MTKKIKILLSILLLSITISTNAVESITVSAVVGNINHAPIIISITPNNNPKLLASNSLQNFSILFRDDEKNHIYYTITTEVDWWYTSPISWEISLTDYLWTEAKINFSYLSWDNTWTKKITITLNDWPNVISKDINLYIY